MKTLNIFKRNKVLDIHIKLVGVVNFDQHQSKRRLSKIDKQPKVYITKFYAFFPETFFSTVSNEMKKQCMKQFSVLSVVGRVKK
jgi:hypothetical protein